MNEAYTMTTSLEELYPKIVWWTQSSGWIELGRDDSRRSFIRVLDIGGTVWEGKEQYDSADIAMDEAEKFIAQWRRENSC